MRNQFLFIVVLSLSFWLWSCAESDADKVGDAQACLNNTTTNDVDDCLDLVKNLKTSEAYIVHCSILYYQAGFDDETFAEIFEAISQSDNSNPTLAALPFLSFSTSDAASEAQEICEKSDSPGLSLISGLSVMATTITQTDQALVDLITGGGTPTEDEIKSALSNLDTDDEESLGESALLLQDSYCGESSTADEEVCGEIDEAIDDETDPEIIGEQLADLLNN